MKGVLLAGGTGSRLHPLTLVTNKHLLPVYDKPMIFHPLGTLVKAGLKEILIVTGPEHAGNFMQLLGSGKEFGVHLTYRIQDEAGGIAQALGMAKDFAAGGPVTVILGDNIFEDDFRESIQGFQSGARIFLKKVPDPQRFGVPTLEGEKVIKITEKPTKPESDYAVTGIYIYDAKVFDVIRDLKPSKRGELEITDVSNWYIDQGIMDAQMVQGFWSDAGTLESLFRASSLVYKKMTNDK